MDWTLDPFRHVMGAYFELAELSTIAREFPIFRGVLESQLRARLTEAVRMIPLCPSLVIDLYRMGLLTQGDLENYLHQAITTANPALATTILKNSSLSLDTAITRTLSLIGTNEHNLLSLADLVLHDPDYYHDLIPRLCQQAQGLPIANSGQLLEEVLDALDLLRQYELESPFLVSYATTSLASSILFSIPSAPSYMEDFSVNPVIPILRQKLSSPSEGLEAEVHKVISTCWTLRDKLLRLIPYL